MQNRLDTFFEFGDVRAAPIRLPTLRTFLKVVIVQARQRLQLVNHGFFGYGDQQTVTAQTPGKRREGLSKVEAPARIRARRAAARSHHSHAALQFDFQLP